MKTLAIILAVTAGVGYNSTATAADFPVMGQTLSNRHFQDNLLIHPDRINLEPPLEWVSLR